MKYYTGIILSLTLSIHCWAQQASQKPRLVVGIMIDGLQQKHIDILRKQFDTQGFNKLLNQGAVCRNVAYTTTSAGNASDIATVMTGSTPNYHGIVGNYFFNRNNEEVESILLDENQVGIGTRETYSAHYLLSSTFNDEVMLTYPEQSKSYAVALGPEEAIMLGGHTAKSVAWVDPINFRWSTTGYYADGLSKWADEMNVNGTFKAIRNQNWEPLYSIETYYQKPEKSYWEGGFRYDPGTKSGQGTILCRTPFANTLVTQLALKLIENEKMGTDASPDVLMLQYTVRTPYERTQALQSAEQEDMYLRLDKEIQHLLQRIQEMVGLENTVIFVFGNQTPTHSPMELGNNKIPAGYFNADRSLALLSSYLVAMYGQEKWISGYYGKNIYLNKDLILQRKLNLSDFQSNVADFMLEFEGIQTAYPTTALSTVAGSNDPEVNRIRSSNHNKRMGDVIITLLPGWIEVDKKNRPVGEANAIVPYTPLYWLGGRIKSQKIVKSYNVTDIAPSIVRLLDVSMPNACLGKPIEELFK